MTPHVQRAAPHDFEAWHDMRCALWPDSAGEHRAEIDRFFAGDRREPAEVLLAFDERGPALGFEETSRAVNFRKTIRGRV